MDIRLNNCNNISRAMISVTEGRLNIKYAINGTGKSTISKAIEAVSRNDNAALQELTPFQFIGDGDPTHVPSVEGLPADIRIAVFDESYVDQYDLIRHYMIEDSDYSETVESQLVAEVYDSHSMTVTFNAENSGSSFIVRG